MEAKPSLFRNKVLCGLSPEDLALLQPHLDLVELPLRKVLEACNRPPEMVYFLESGQASMVVSGGAQHNIEAGIIGSEGMTGHSLMLGADSSPRETFIQTAGQAWRIRAGALTTAVDQSPTLRRQLLRHVHVFWVQMSFTVLANGRYRLDERLARWLLMALDRSSTDKLQITHEFLSMMLGVRRPGVTVALNQFESKNLIRSHRGGMTILDRTALEAAANGSYGAPEAEYERLFGHA